MRALSDLRPSVRATYDSRDTGPQFHVTTRLGDRTIGFQEPIDDPFIRHAVRIGLIDLLRGLFRRGLVVEMIVGGDRDVVNDVLELDENTLIAGRTRKAAWDQSLTQKLRAM